jgi:hypothetical protein
MPRIAAGNFSHSRRDFMKNDVFTMPKIADLASSRSHNNRATSGYNLECERIFKTRFVKKTKLMGSTTLLTKNSVKRYQL